MNRTKKKKECETCGESFVPKTIDSVFCSKKCSNVAYWKKKALQKKEMEREMIKEQISDNRSYISVPEAIALFDINKSTLYRLIRLKRIPAINLGTRHIRIDRVIMEEMFSISETSATIKEENPKAKLYSLEPEDCYTIGEITEKFGISNTSVYTHIRKYSIPTRQIGKYVYAPKSEIDHLYK